MSVNDPTPTPVVVETQSTDFKSLLAGALIAGVFYGLGKTAGVVKERYRQTKAASEEK